MKEEITISRRSNKGTTLDEFRSLWLIDSKSEICFRFDNHSDFGVDWDDGDEPEHIVQAQFFGEAERKHGSTWLEQVTGDETLLTIHHRYKDRSSSGPVSISIRGYIINWKAGAYIYSSLSELKKAYYKDCEPCHLLGIEQFGPVGLGNMAFLNCQELTRLPEKEKPDSHYLTDTSWMFCFAERLNTSLNHWDVSNVKNMAGMFYYARAFDQSLNNWNVSNVEDMSGMFYDAWDFDQSLNRWDVSHVKDMSCMFKGAEYFNQPLNNWDVSNVENMSEMFYDAYNFNQPLSKWNVSHVKNMRSMFGWAICFNKPLNKWNVSSVADMSCMFWEAFRFNQPLHKWNVSNVESIYGMLHGATKFKRSLRQWKLPDGISISEAFKRAFNGIPLDEDG